MKRIGSGIIATLVALCVFNIAKADSGPGGVFTMAGIASAFRPVVGHGGIYETTRQNGSKETKEMSVVGKEPMNGKEGYWVEFSAKDEKSGKPQYGKMLFTKNELQSYSMVRMISQPPDQPPIEMPVNQKRQFKSKVDEKTQWNVVGTETITVPAGTYSCKHWQNSAAKYDVWVSDKVSPFGIVKDVTPGETMVLVKQITDAKDHITGTPITMEQMMQRMKPH